MLTIHNKMHLFQFYKCFLSERELWYVFALVPCGMYTQINVSHFWRTKFTFTSRNVVHNRTYTISIQNETEDNDQMGCLPFIHGAHEQKGLKTIGLFVLCPKKCDNHEWFVIFCVLCYIASIVFACEKYSFFLQKGKLMVFCVVTFFLCSFKKSEEFLVNLDIKRKEWNSTVF